MKLRFLLKGESNVERDPSCMMDTTKVVIITAAGRGIGASTARELAKDHKLVLMSRSNEASELASELGGIGIAGSVTKESDLSRLVETALDKYGRVDQVVNNTGHPAKGDLLEISDCKWHENLDLLLLNVVRMARLVTEQMIEQGGGEIVNISSVAAIEPSLRFPVSSTLRSALSSFTRLYADRYAAEGIRMNSILLGHFENLPREKEEVERIPMRRCGTMEEAARTVRFLLSDGASYITGQSIELDGGSTRSF